MYGSSSVLHPVGHDATDSSARFIRSTYYAAMLRGEFGKLHFPLVKGRDGHLLTARWLTEQQQYMPLWSSCDILYKLQGLFQFAYPPPRRGGFSLSFCYDHLLNDPQGSSRCGSAGDGMSLLQELIVYGVGITEW